jgi:hypothetical protein
MVGCIRAATAVAKPKLSNLRNKTGQFQDGVIQWEIGAEL